MLLAGCAEGNVPDLFGGRQARPAPVPKSAPTVSSAPRSVVPKATTGESSPRKRAPSVVAPTAAPPTAPAGAATAPPAPAAETQPAPPGPASPEPDGKKEVRVAILLPLSGPRAALGRAMLDAAQMALFELADEGFALLPFDTEGTPEGAAVAAARALEAGVGLLLGPLLADSVRAAAPLARSAGVPVVAFSNSREVAGDGVFILGFVPRQQVEAIVGYAIGQGLVRFAVLAPDDAYGQAVVAALRAITAARGAIVTRVEFYDPGAADFSAPVKALADYEARHRALLQQRAALEARDDEVSRQALKRLERRDTIGDVDFDAVLLPAGGQTLRALASLLSFYDVDQPAVRFLGMRIWDDTPGIGTEPALLRAWFAAPPRAEREKFARRYQGYFGRPPPRLASLAYDATALAAVLAQSVGGADFSVDALTNPQGFLGVDGLFRLRRDGVVERRFAILEVRRDGFRVRRAAPATFATTANR